MFGKKLEEDTNEEANVIMINSDHQALHQWTL